MPRLASLLSLLALLALPIAGCGGDDNDTTTSAQATSTAETSATGTSETGATKNGSPIASAASAHALPPGVQPGKHGPHYFETPSHNIGCFLGHSSARCDIRERDWSPPPKPQFCIDVGVDWGQGIGVGQKKKAEFTCAGDTVLGGPGLLPYGSYAVRGSVGCLSQKAGIICQNIDTRHGFFLSRESYRIY